MVEFEFDFEEILDEKPFWLIRMLFYLAMICIGFGLYAHFSKEVKVYEAQLKIITIYDYDWNRPNVPLGELIFEYMKRLEDFQFDPMIKEVIGLSFDTQVSPVVQGVISVLSSDPSISKEAVVNTANLVKTQLDPFVKSFGNDTTVSRVNIMNRLEQAQDASKVWIMGAIGVFLFLVSLYFGLKA